MVEAIVRDKRVIACAAYCEDEYGIALGKGEGLFVGVPCVLGVKGVEKVISFKMNDEEQKYMNESISHVRDLIAVTQRAVRKWRGFRCAGLWLVREGVTSRYLAVR